jgi:LysM repeat protein
MAQSHPAHNAQSLEKPAAPENVQTAQDNLPKAGDQTSLAGTSDQTSSIYHIQRGDNLWDISRKQLGDPMRWKEVYGLNQELIGKNPDLIFSGTDLKLPGTGQIAGAGEYIVKPGDSLWSIAQKQMGSAPKWGDLYHANQGTIGVNPSLILPGQHLHLPGMPAVNQVSQLPAPQAMAPQGTPMADASSMSQGTGFAQGSQLAQGSPPMPQAQGLEGQSFSTAQGPAAPSAPSGFMQVHQSNSLPMGPGAAGAAELNSGGSVVSSSMNSDLLSILHRRPN